MKHNYDSFKKYVSDHIKKHLPDEYADAEIKFKDIQKAGGVTYEGMMIDLKDQIGFSAVPALNLTLAFQEYEQGRDLDSIVSGLADVRIHASLPEGVKAQSFLDYEYAKDKILPRLVNAKANAAYLADKPHVDIEDLSVMYTMRVQENEDGVAEAIICNHLMEAWGVNAEEISNTAMANLAQRRPFFANIEEVLFGGGVKDMPSEEFSSIEDIDPGQYDMPFFVLSNEHKTKGAVTVLDPKTMTQITNKLGEVYIIPSSVDEVLIVPQSCVDSVAHLSKMVTDVNNEAVAPQDQLSNNVYEFDLENQTITIAADPVQSEVQSM